MTTMQSSKRKKNAGASFALRMTVAAVLLGATGGVAQTPDTFTWVGGSNAWEAAGAWSPAATTRTAPGIAGDKIVTTNASTIVLTGSTTVSSISASGGSLSLPTTGVVTQTFESASTAVTNRIYSAGQHLYIGDGLVDDDLTLNIVDNLLFSGNHSGHLYMFVRGIVSGGTTEAPISVLSEVNNNEWNTFRVHLMNTNNTFRGDVYVGAAGTGSKGNLFLYLGHSSVKGADSMLGHPDNKVILRNQRPNLCVSQGYADGLKRRVLGTGNVRGLRVDTAWPTITYADSLTLGDGSSLEPSAEPSNPIGRIAVIGTTITTHTNSQIRVSVSETTNDVVAVSPTAPFTYAGKVLIEPLSPDIAVGTSWPIMTVAAAATAFTFNPSSVPTGYSFNTTGNATAGWVVTATKLADTSAAPAVQNLSATMIAETNATIHADVLGLAPDNQASLRAYFGTVDRESDFGAWDHVVDYPAAITELGVYSQTLNTLDVNTTYYVRHSVSNSAGEVMSLDVTSFTTRPWETPDVFTWAATNADWFAEHAWSVDTPYARTTPQYAGDDVIVDAVSTYGSPAGVDKSLNLTQDAAIRSMTIRNGYGRTVTVNATNGPASLIFDSGPGGTNLWNSPGQLSVFRFGGAQSNDDLTVEFRQPTVFRRTSAWTLSFWNTARWVGGSEETPADILISTVGDQYCQMDLYLMNSNSTFRGDVYVGDSAANASSARLLIGSGTTPAENGMLGNAANRVILRNHSTLLYNAGTNESAAVARHVAGSGTLTSTKALHLAAGAMLDPQPLSGTGTGTISLAASALTTDDAARYRIHVSTNSASDRLSINVSSPLTLSGHLDLVPQDGAEAVAGARWTVISVATNATAFTSNLSKTPGYRLITAGDSGSGWTVSAERVTGGTLMTIF